ncbi:uncharacterized protein UV8b_05309 [Ustilaginoidea virens]|uniref:Uncharacterized protein n=1 Tax=Ustilaginoidea virens TaxID=1159556 RepID=A0A8E5MIT1_USTVR|nr:uncharacterized protein UV8b_05309 [Ustilaginoidea virens]QUC21066.1 hypothetical protein UV8b_05309 [Ustilaginoidea virens]
MSSNFTTSYAYVFTLEAHRSVASQPTLAYSLGVSLRLSTSTSTSIYLPCPMETDWPEKIPGEPSTAKFQPNHTDTLPSRMAVQEQKTPRYEYASTPFHWHPQAASMSSVTPARQMPSRRPRLVR